jgi:FHS family glucose/mannose:H+ symporter-like MFS transporter
MPVQPLEPAAAVASGGLLKVPGARRALAGFFISGVLLAFLGSILLSWEHHLTGGYGIIALYFLGLIAGLAISVPLSERLLARKGLAWTLSSACAVAGVAFLYLAFVSPPLSFWWRVAGLAMLGYAAGALHSAIFHAISPMYRHDPAATVNLAGILFGLGCFAEAVLISGAFYAYSAATLQVWLAVIPALFGWMYWKTPFGPLPGPDQPAPATLLSAARNPGAVLLSLVLFFQFGNEWAVAGWLALFLSQRLGVSPASALHLLALYWLALLVGRVAAQWILPRIRHGRLLLGSAVASIFGCVILSATNNQFGAVTGILALGAAYAPIYPLVVEKIGSRFPFYHPGFYNGLFSCALGGGLLAPALLGVVASVWGLGAVMILPLTGSVIVCLLLMLIWLEARLSAHARPPQKA